MSELLFWPLAALLVAAALGVVLARDLYRAAYSLAAGLVTTAVFYLALGSPLLAAVQLLLYTGGVLTLVVYALTITARHGEPPRWRRPVPALILSALVLLTMLTGLEGLPVADAPAAIDDGTAVGVELFTRYLVPFELLSVLLLGAIFGALVIARREPS